MGIYNLDKIFKCESVAVIGADEENGSIGSTHLVNLMNGGYQGKIFPVNPDYSVIHGIKAFPSLADIANTVDLAIIAVSVDHMLFTVEECARAGVGGAIITSAEGKEDFSPSQEIEEQIRKVAKREGLRIIGPKCLGFLCPGRRLNGSLVAQMPPVGKLAFVSQSGAICTAILDFALKEGFGFSYFVSTGSVLDVDVGDLIDYFGNDPEVKSILLYMESLTNFRKFMSAARSVSRIKPIAVVKAGRSPAGMKAAISHVGRIVGEDAVYDAAFKRAGVVRVNSIRELFDCAELLSKKPLRCGPRLAIVSNSGGAGVMAADALAGYGLEPAPLKPECLQRLDELLPPSWSHGNPIDILGDASPERYARVTEVCLQEREVDGMLVILTPQMTTDSSGVAQQISQIFKRKSYPVFATWMGGSGVDQGRNILKQTGIPTYDTPEQAIRAFFYLHQYSRNLEELQEIPPKLSSDLWFYRDHAQRLINVGLKRVNGCLTEIESKELFAAYGIPVMQATPATTVEEAVKRAQQVGYPLVMKIHSPDIMHKTEAGGVKLDIRNESDVRAAYEKITGSARAHQPQAAILGVTLQPMIERGGHEIFLGCKADDNFGPIILFGMGGVLAEIFEDRAIGLLPINRTLARRLMERTRVYSLLQGYGNRPAANLELLEEMILRISQLVMDFPEIVELDINPVIINGGKPCAVDGLVRVKPAVVSSPLHLVISPYPSQYEYRVAVKGGLHLLIRPIKPEDAPLFVELFNLLSPTSIFYRFFSPLKSLSPDMLVRFTQIDYDREIALVALDKGLAGERMLGVVRVISDPDGRRAEFAVLVGDPWQGRGVGAALLERVLQISKERGIETVWGTVLRENTQALALGRKLGFKISRGADFSEMELSIDLRSLHLNDDEHLSQTP